MLTVLREVDKESDNTVFVTSLQAYDVLSDEKKRQIYDTYGEEGLKGGVPDSGPGAGGFPGGAGPGGMPQGFTFSTGGGPGAFYSFGDGMAPSSSK